MLILQNPELLEASLIENPYEYFLGEKVLLDRDELISEFIQ